MENDVLQIHWQNILLLYSHSTFKHNDLSNNAYEIRR